MTINESDFCFPCMQKVLLPGSQVFCFSSHTTVDLSWVPLIIQGRHRPSGLHRPIRVTLTTDQSGAPPIYQGTTGLSGLLSTIRGTTDLSEAPPTFQGTTCLSRTPLAFEGILDLSGVPPTYEGITDQSRHHRSIRVSTGLTGAPPAFNLRKLNNRKLRRGIGEIMDGAVGVWDSSATNAIE